MHYQKKFLPFEQSFFIFCILASSFVLSVGDFVSDKFLAKLKKNFCLKFLSLFILPYFASLPCGVKFKEAVLANSSKAPVFLKFFLKLALQTGLQLYKAA